MRINAKLAGAMLTAAMGFGALAPSMPIFANVNEAEVAAEDQKAAEDYDWVYEEEEPAVEEEKSMGPLTPDGNMTLVDDYGSEKAGKQFITLTSKDGNFFYLIIDRDDHGEETVHFLNLVDEEDLMALVDDDTAQDLQAQKDAAEAARKAAEEALKKQQEEDAKKTVEEPVEEKKSSPLAALILVLILGGVGAGGAYIYLQNQKKAKESGSKDPDEDWLDDDDEEEINAEEEKEDEFEYLDEEDFQEDRDERW